MNCTIIGVMRFTMYHRSIYINRSIMYNRREGVDPDAAPVTLYKLLHT